MFCLYILNDTLLSHVWTSALCVLTHKFCGLTTKLLYFVDFIILLVIRLTNKFSDRIFCTWVECERLYASTFIKSRPFNTRFNHKRKKERNIRESNDRFLKYIDILIVTILFQIFLKYHSFLHIHLHTQTKQKILLHTHTYNNNELIGYRECTCV